MQAWRKKKGLMRAAKYTTVLEPMEREVLGDLTATVSEALIARAQSAPKDELAELTGISSGHKDTPEDPSLARLLPDFAREGDEEFDGENSLMRSLHENDICREKLAHLQIIGQAVGPDGGVEISLSEEEAHAFISGLNDLRLYVSAGEIAGGEGAQEDRDSLVEWLAFNQDSLLNAMMGQ
ncbi:DUF2017 domain-containing protein [Corynebacterium halotolerans]|uniref:Uncharacterized protein n=1 Tax=Corynebacterium halotolerans YIM 70093 = DSM 44683 TaxID=1121362 RepID=M1P0K4_9CORY|nr:DUF2017 domain-containing protein [Corynebacterium halotolerans]AGF73315.1 hypothetical protein A605_11585 [Corynebacterium halotolerans YIM 70093 = DSM 44683]